MPFTRLLGFARNNSLEMQGGRRYCAEVLREESLAVAEEKFRAAGCWALRAPRIAFRTDAAADAVCLLVGAPSETLTRWTEIVSEYFIEALPSYGIPEVVVFGDYKKPLAGFISFKNRLKELAKNGADGSWSGGSLLDYRIPPLSAGTGQACC
jgi:hypothetical protein